MVQVKNLTSNPIGQKKVSEVLPILGFIASDWDQRLHTGKGCFLSFGRSLRICTKILVNSVKNN